MSSKTKSIPFKRAVWTDYRPESCRNSLYFKIVNSGPFKVNIKTYLSTKILWTTACMEPIFPLAGEICYMKISAEGLRWLHWLHGQNTFINLFTVWISICMYTVFKGGGVFQTDKHLPQIPCTGQFFLDDDILLWCLYIYLVHGWL